MPQYTTTPEFVQGISNAGKAAFCRLMQRVTEELDVRRVYASHGCLRVPGEHMATELPRIDIVLTGVKHMQWKGIGGREDCLLTPGDVHYEPPGTGKLALWDKVHEMSSIVFFRTYLRVTYINNSVPTSRSLPDAAIFYHTSRPPSPDMMALCNLITHQVVGPDSYGVAPRLMKALLCMVRQSLEEDEQDETSGRQLTWLRLMAYMQENFTRPITRESLARVHHLSPGYVSQLFADEGRETFSACLRRLRLEHACNLLKGSNDTIASIAESCGYMSPNCFHSTFRQAFGVSPNQFRRQFQLQSASGPKTHP